MSDHEGPKLLLEMLGVMLGVVFGGTTFVLAAMWWWEHLWRWLGL